jgi:hypothetical protein
MSSLLCVPTPKPFQGTTVIDWLAFSLLSKYSRRPSKLWTTKLGPQGWPITDFFPSLTSLTERKTTQNEDPYDLLLDLERHFWTDSMGAKSSLNPKGQAREENNIQFPVTKSLQPGIRRAADPLELKSKNLKRGTERISGFIPLHISTARIPNGSVELDPELDDSNSPITSPSDRESQGPKSLEIKERSGSKTSFKLECSAFKPFPE